MHIIAIGVGGFLGAIFRYYIGEIIPYEGDFPIATLTVNLIGVYLLSTLLFYPKLIFNNYIKQMLTTGFLGSFTTFSAFSMESLTLLKNSEYVQFIIYITISVFGSIFFVFLGAQSAKIFQQTN